MSRLRFTVGAAAWATALVLAVAGMPSPRPARASPPAPIARLCPAGCELARGELLVGVTGSGAAEAAAEAAGGVVSGRSARLETARITLPDSADLWAAAARLRLLPGVVSVEPNWRRRALLQPNDPWYNADPPGVPNGRQWAPQAIGSPAAWDRTTGSAQVTLAILDTGVNADAANLAGRVVAGPDYIDGDDNPSDSHGHGTDVAALAAATGNDATGIAGIDWKASVLAVRVLDDEAGGSDFDIGRGVVWAADRGAKVILMSLGAPVYSMLLGRAVAYAQAKGALVVAAVGNDGLPLPVFPAAYPGVLGVGAVDRNDDLAWFSAYGEAVDVVAPGTDVLSPAPSPRLVSGTSFSAALAAGGAAVVAASNPALSGAQVGDRLVATADDLGRTGKDDRFGAGRINLDRATGGSPSGPAPPSRDSHEPNDERNQATLVSLGQDVNGTFQPAGDEDWYRVQAPGGLLRADLTLPNPAGSAKVDGAIHILDAAGTQIAAVNRAGTGGAETITANVAQGTVYVRVRNLFGNGSPSAYQLRVQTGSQQDTPADNVPPDARIADLQRIGDGSQLRIKATGFDDLSASVRFRYDVRSVEEFAAISPRFDMPSGDVTANVPDGVVLVAVWAVDDSSRQDPAPSFALAGTGRARSQGSELASLFPYDPSFSGGVSVSTGDVDGDGFDEVLTGAGPGGGPHVKATRASGGAVVGSFFAFDPGFRGGVRVAGADVDGDGFDEVVTAAGPTGGPHVRVWSLRGGVPVMLSQWFAYDARFTGGVYVAGGDVNGDGSDEIVTGAGEGGGPHVRVFRSSGTETGSFFAFDPAFGGGVRVGSADLDASGRDAVVVGAGPGGGPHVRALRLSGPAFTQVASFFAYDAGFRGGVHVAAGDLDGDLRGEIVTGPGRTGGPHVRIFDRAGVQRFDMFAFTTAFTGGVRVAVGDTDRDLDSDLVVAAGPGGGPHVRSLE